ncbi:hypothetical protein D9M71_114590 [compost metagenome]
MVPARIARKVPISTRPLPPTNSSSRKAWGRMEYLTGPNSAEWVPMANSANSIIHRWLSIKPAAPTSMMAISPSLIRRIKASLAYFSPNCPANAENRKNGRINSKAHRLTQIERSPSMVSL